MLKQVFSKEQLSKVMLSADVWKWKLLHHHGSVENAINHVVDSWNQNSLDLSELASGRAKGKTIFRPANVSDHFALRILDRFIRRVYKVRQSDRNRITKQLICTLKDSGAHHILRLDIKNCYESIELKSLIDKFENDLILSPECIKLLKKSTQYLLALTVAMDYQEVYALVLH